MKKLQKLSKDKEEEVIVPEEDATSFFNMVKEPELRITGVYGDINEEKSSEVVYGLMTLHFSGQQACEAGSSDDPDSKDAITFEPIDFYVSTYGGSATEMFAIYDAMRSIRDLTPVRTHGLGKVMSAGVLLLAAGTKGTRRIGRYCRVMIHGVVAGTQGFIADVENEFAETKNTQKMYIKALSEETNMEEKYIKKLMSKKKNVYLNADEAVNLGIADIIV
jgi:ATP-dependent Clp endopeptidase proteolytic subunit ClpP